jgi:hypothetical protein
MATRVRVIAYITPSMEGKILVTEEVLNNVGAYVTYPCRVASKHVEPPEGELPPIDVEGDLHTPNIVFVAYVANMAKATQLKNYILSAAQPEDQILMEISEVTVDIFTGLGIK